MPFTIRDIPAAMRSNGWMVGAQVMDRWFDRPARVMTERDKRNITAWPDKETRLVTMDWALRFSRVADGQRHLLASWASPERLAAARPNIEDRFRTALSARPGQAAAFRFGDLAKDAVTIDTSCQANREVIESSIFGAVDDFYCAIGNGLLMLAVSGMAKPLGPKRWRLAIDEVATCLRDSYEFVGPQRLGAWGPDGFSRIAVLAPEVPIIAEQPHSDGQGRYFTVRNESFDAYRDHYKMGGDFVIYSDVRRHKLKQVVTLDIQA